MRKRIGVCAAISCVGSAIVGLASCENEPNAPSGPKFDGSLSPDVSLPDATLPFDAGPGDAGACAPGSLTGFTVPPYVSAREQMFVCYNAEWNPLAEACVGDASTLSACANFGTTGGEDGGPIDPDCASCFDPNNVDAGVGPLVNGSVVMPNIAGCVETADPTDAGFDCARAIAAAAACVEYACKPSCPVTDESSRQAYLACAKAAAVGVSATYTTAANACISTEIEAENHGITSFCFPPDASTVEQFAQIARYFCLS